MELKPGYKQTETGVVPQDWLDYTVGELIDFEGGSQPDKSWFSPSWKPGYIRMIQIRDYKTNKYETYVPIKLARRFCTENDIMIGRYGPPIFQILRGLSGAYNVALIKAVPRSHINRTYAYYFLKQEKLFAFIEKLSQRTSGQTGVDLKELRGYPLPLPPTKAEQEAIAEALSDADALIESLEQLISKKCQIKQGAMQELLTGKRRLPGSESKPGYKQTEVGVIPEDWNCVQLPALMSQTSHSIKIGPFGSALKRELLTKEGYKVYGQENVYERNMTVGERFISAEHFRKLKSCEVKPGDFLISMMGTVGKCFVVPINIEAGIMDSHLLRLRLGPSKLDAEYLSQLFQTRIISDQVKQLSVGGIMEGLSSKIIKLLQLPVPEIEEQTAIAAILNDMDAEIAALGTKLTKARQVKQGMMQELLTGRIRLI